VAYLADCRSHACILTLLGTPARPDEGRGYKNTKYLTKVVFMPQRNGGYWSDKGYEWYGGT